LYLPNNLNIKEISVINEKKAIGTKTKSVKEITTKTNEIREAWLEAGVEKV
jgi:hypothetical protein